ncbi:hypothetical protein AVEN_260729-1 [Araneus ventricosus]|uniref:Uncharacterized protein n=1 Tax=Araneus ventricosus TaxID=182803 RepID=A0A4Y2PPZ6_ARAVE|nr:hypothetical protein AVEN_260729-1 [Araneus ventricosus]
MSMPTDSRILFHYGSVRPRTARLTREKIEDLASTLSEDFFVHKSYQRMSPAASDFIFTRTERAGSPAIMGGFPGTLAE